MPIFYHEKTKEFHIQGQGFSYIIKILKNKQPGQVYFGKKINDQKDFSHLIQYPSSAPGLTAMVYDDDHCQIRQGDELLYCGLYLKPGYSGTDCDGHDTCGDFTGEIYILKVIN
ncbi:MAG: hypothetical protein MJB14_16880 [Spirochaetes bacterium]|nr:hypothetical protein [Spirochaetota bacterium]